MVQKVRQETTTKQYFLIECIIVFCDVSGAVIAIYSIAGLFHRKHFELKQEKHRSNKYHY